MLLGRSTYMYQRKLIFGSLNSISHSLVWFCNKSDSDSSAKNIAKHCDAYTKLIDRKRKEMEKQEAAIKKLGEQEKLKKFTDKCLEDQKKKLYMELQCMEKEKRKLHESMMHCLNKGIKKSCKKLAQKKVVNKKKLGENMACIGKKKMIKQLLSQCEKTVLTKKERSQISRYSKSHSKHSIAQRRRKKAIKEMFAERKSGKPKTVSDKSPNHETTVKETSPKINLAEDVLKAKCEEEEFIQVEISKVMKECMEQAKNNKLEKEESLKKDREEASGKERTKKLKDKAPKEKAAKTKGKVNILKEKEPKKTCKERTLTEQGEEEATKIKKALRKIKREKNKDALKKACEEKIIQKTKEKDAQKKKKIEALRKKCEAEKKKQEALKKKSQEILKSKEEDLRKACKEKAAQKRKELNAQEKRNKEEALRKKRDEEKALKEKKKKSDAFKKKCEETKKKEKALRKSCEERNRKKHNELEALIKKREQEIMKKDEALRKVCEEKAQQMKAMKEKETLRKKCEDEKETKKKEESEQDACKKDDVMCHFRSCLYKPLKQQDFQPGNKVSIVGAGGVGMASAITLLAKGVTNNIAIYDIKKDMCAEERESLLHGSLFLNNCSIDKRTSIECTKDSRVVVFTTGARTKPKESRLQIAQKSAEIVKEIMPQLVKQSPKAVFIIAANPADVMTWVARKVSNLPYERCFSSGCHLDTARFRMFIAKMVRVSTSSVYGFVVGEHGDHSVPLWSSVTIGGARLQKIIPNIGTDKDPMRWSDIHKDVVEAAYKVIDGKGHTNWGIGLTITDIVSAIFENSNRILSLSTNINGICGFEDEIFLSLPCIVNQCGLHGVINPQLSDWETKMLKKSAKVLLDAQKRIKF